MIHHQSFSIFSEKERRYSKVGERPEGMPFHRGTPDGAEQKKERQAPPPLPPEVLAEAPEEDVDVSEFSEEDSDFQDFEAFDSAIAKEAIARLPDYTDIADEEETSSLSAEAREEDVDLSGITTPKAADIVEIAQRLDAINRMKEKSPLTQKNTDQLHPQERAMQEYKARTTARLPDYSNTVRDKEIPPPLPAEVSPSQEMKLSPELYNWMYNKKDSFKAFGEEQGIAIAADGTVKGWRENRKLKRMLASRPELQTRFDTLKVAQAKQREAEETARQGTLARKEAQQNPMNVKPEGKLTRWGKRLAFALGLSAAGGAAGNVISSAENMRTEAAMRQADNNATEAFGVSKADIFTKDGLNTVGYASIPSDPVSFQTMKGREINPDKQALRDMKRTGKEVAADSTRVSMDLSEAPAEAPKTAARDAAPLASEPTPLPRDALRKNLEDQKVSLTGAADKPAGGYASLQEVPDTSQDREKLFPEASKAAKEVAKRRSTDQAKN